MLTEKNKASSVQYFLRWSARVLSILSTAVIVLFLTGERFDVSRISGREWIGLFLFPLGVIVGFAVAWWNEGMGGAITTASLLAFYLIYGLLLRGNINLGWAFIVFASPGLLFLLSWLRSTKPAALHT
jgi:hypothetical protein